MIQQRILLSPPCCKVARQAAESYLNQALITQTITEKYDRLSNPTIYLSVSPVIAVHHFSIKMV
jgi:hypothetical protein